MKITFSENAKGFILDALGTGVKKGKIINKDTGEYILDNHGNSVKFKEFAGIHKDFGIIKSDFNSIVEFADFMKKRKNEKN